MEPFDVPGLGRCVPESHGYEFLCKAPVWSPRPGSVELATKGPGIICPTSNFDNAWAPMNLLPGLSPVYKWSTLPIDAPSLEYAMARDGMFGHRPEKQIALLKRKAIVKEARFAIVP